MIALNNDAVIAFLKEKGLKAVLQPETDQVLVVLKVLSTEYPLFIRILTDGPVLQLLVFLPSPLKEETLAEISRLLHLLNKEMDIPGFGMDESSGVIFYRISIPALNKKIDTTLLETYINSIEVICRSFTPVIHNVSQGTMTFAAVQQKSLEAHKKSK